jgi:hypothetical protein
MMSNGATAPFAIDEGLSFGAGRKMLVVRKIGSMASEYIRASVDRDLTRTPKVSG